MLAKAGKSSLLERRFFVLLFVSFDGVLNYLDIF